MSSEAITRNDLKNILNKVLPESRCAIYKILYDSSKISNGTLTLSEPYTNFDYLIVSYLVNVDTYAEIFDCTRIQAYPSHSYQGDIVVYNGTTVYASSCKFTATDATHFAVTNSGNNSNFIAGITRIIGVKNPSIPADTIDLKDYVIEQGTAKTTHSTSGTTTWTYRKWNSGIAECWGTVNVPSATYAANGGYKSFGFNFPTGLFNVAPTCLTIAGGLSNVVQTDIGFTHIDNNVYGQSYLINRHSSSVTVGGWAYIHVMGTWK